MFSEQGKLRLDRVLQHQWLQSKWEHLPIVVLLQEKKTIHVAHPNVQWSVFQTPPRRASTKCRTDPPSML